MQQNWVYDYETLVNCFIAVFQHYKNEDDRKVFVIWNDRNDLDALYEFYMESINNKSWHISYNGLSFDAQITQYIINNYPQLKTESAPKVANILYKYAQDIIQRSDRKEFLDYPPHKLYIRQIDLFKMNHWDNPAKSSSLKWLQYSMDWINVEEMPVGHYEIVNDQATIDTIISYCINDVRSTSRVLILSKEQLALRQSLTKEYDINLYNASEPRISKELFAYFLCKKLSMDKKTLKALRTPRPFIALNDVILPTIKFKTPEFNSVLDYFRNQVIVNTKGSLSYSINYKGVTTDYGLGGIHGARTAGIYEATPGYTIMTSDVTSFYPNLAIRNGFHPEHLPKKEFCELYEWFFDERKKIPKTDPKNYVYKIILNSTYGLSNDENSFLYDPRFTMQITINGQLQLSMLYEMLSEIPGCIPLMQNTDGLEMMIPVAYKDRYLEICKEWETLTSLQLEHDEYQKMIIADVNNYIAVYKNGKTKCKGRFEWEDLEKKKVAVLHKNKSFLIIPKAIYAYFVNGIKPEDFLAANRNFYDYCAGAKAKGQWRFVMNEVKNGVVSTTQLHKIIRYYVSKHGCKLSKRHLTDGREIQLESGRWMQTVINDMTKRTDKVWDDLKIDNEYYLQQIYAEINNIDKKVTRNYTQLALF